MAKLILKFSNKTIQDIAIDKVITIGRHPDNHIHIDNLAVSVFHAKIVKEEDTFFIEDLDSLNGTFLNGKMVKKSELDNNDEITIGKHTLVFLKKEAKASPPPSDFALEKTMLLDTAKHREMSNARQGPMPGDKVGVLKIIDGSTKQTEYELEGSYATIGKDKVADIRIKGIFAPKIAALVQRSGEAYYINPPEKGKRPLINGKPVEKPTEIKENDTLEAGGVKMIFFIRKIKEGVALS